MAATDLSARRRAAPRGAGGRGGRGGAPRVAIFAEACGDWHVKRLKTAFAAHGLVGVRTRLADCGVAHGAPGDLLIPGFADRLPDAALVRAVEAGGFEAVTLRLGVLHGLQEHGVLVWNEARAIERAVDKSMTGFLLRRAGVATPDAWTVTDRGVVERLLSRELAQGSALVVKPLFGSRGRGVSLLRATADIPGFETCGGVWHLQRFVPRPGPPYRDWRLLVVKGTVVGAMQRESNHWVTNIGHGGAPRTARPSAAMAKAAAQAAAALGLAYAGVDLVEDEEGIAQVLEVNSMPAWKGLQSVSDVDIADRLASALAEQLAAQAHGRAGGTAA